MKMTKIFLILGLAFSLSFAAAFEKELKSKHAKVVMQSQQALVVGNNTMQVHVANTQGASVKLKAFMPAMPGMPYMEDVTILKEVSAGVYEGVVNFSMGGTWQIHIFVEPKEGKKYRVKSSVNL